MSRYARMSAALAVLAAATAVAIVPAAGAGARGAVDQPNIVMVMTDDQTLASLTRETMPKTIKRLVRGGTSFEQAIATTPLCCPSRASFLTG